MPVLNLQKKFYSKTFDLNENKYKNKTATNFYTPYKNKGKGALKDYFLSHTKLPRFLKTEENYNPRRPDTMNIT